MARKVQVRRCLRFALPLALLTVLGLARSYAAIQGANRRSPVKGATAAAPEVAVEWVNGLFEDGSSKQHLALQEAARLLMTIAPIVSLADQSGDSVAGLSSIADALDVLDAQELIREGQAAAASLQLDRDLIQLQLALDDGSEKVIDLFRQELGKPGRAM